MIHSDMSEEKPQFNIAGVGEILWDLLPLGKQLGGAPANFAYHAQVLGARSEVVSAIGDDAMGKEILEKLPTINLPIEYITIDNQHPTGTVEVKLDSHGKPDFIIHRDVAWDYIHYSEGLEKLAKKLDAVCFGSLAQRSSISRESIQKFIKSTSDKCLRIFDINIRQNFYDSGLIEENLKMSNCLKLNEDEFPLLSDMFSMKGSEEKIIDKFLKIYDLEIIALTKGKEGSALYTKSTNSFMKSPEVQVVDTVGAGDAFTAAMCHGLLRKFPLNTIHENATRIAAFVCSQKGATPVLPKQLILELTDS
jgi:fructokinase